MNNQESIKQSLESAKMGVSIAATFMQIKEPNVEFIHQSSIKANGINSLYLEKTNTIYFSLEWLETANMAETVHTAFHETRHSYQKQMIDSMEKPNRKESLEILKSWKQDILVYTKPTDERPDSIDYLGQSIEIDAIAFSHFLMKQFFNTETFIPSPIKDKVLSRLKSFR